MKIYPMPLGFLTTLAIAAAALPTQGAEPFTVHEWGTFTTVSGSDGVLLAGLQREEEALPPFVYSHAGFAPTNKGCERPLANVTVKMETPVIYFYSATPQSVKVDVQFPGGSISQWYPQRTSGEILPPAPTAPQSGDRVAVAPAKSAGLAPIDFSRGYQGSASWSVDVLARDSTEKISARRESETPQWPRARVTEANKLRGPKGEVEGFIFYRGVGNFALPITCTSADGKLALRNTATDAIPFLFVYEKSAAFPHGVVWWTGSLDGHTVQSVPMRKDSRAVVAKSVLQKTFPEALERAGLSAEEAQAMLATWHESYFERDGIRVFWIVPRAFTDRILPISVSPKPDHLERVLVGRSEVLTPAFEQELLRDFRADGGKRWSNDRYFQAYRARVENLPANASRPSTPARLQQTHGLKIDGL
ncbi:MAG: hypothetical protein ABIO94_10875 [Opitutaceae bacterium]